MAHHKSAKKRIRQSAKRRIHNRYFAKTTRNAVREFRAIEDQKEAESNISAVISKIDRLAKRGIIHKKKANNLKSKLMKQVNALAK